MWVEIGAYIYLPLSHACMTYAPVESRYKAGELWVGEFGIKYPGPDGVWGGLAAYNPLSGKVAWYDKEKYASSGGALTTASNLVFYSTADRWF